MSSIRSRLAAVAAATLIAALGAAALPADAAAIQRPATPATFVAVWRAADGGDTILLAGGDYGTFTGGRKPAPVTIAAQPGTVARMALDLRGARNITLDGLRLGEITIQDRSESITVRNSTIDGQTVLRTGTLANADILFDGNHHTAWDKCGSCGEGRVFLPEKTDQPSGITIQNSRFGPGGNSDGIQNGSNGTQILNNEFTGIRQIDGDDVHADSIQLYGSEETVIRGNYFHDVSVGIMCADGCDRELVEDNVFDVTGSPYAVTWLSDDSSIIRHNTFAGERTCDYDQRCGVLYLGNKDHDPVSRGTVVTDNILTRICVCDGEVGGLAQEDYNLLREGGRGEHDIRAAPIYVGGPRPDAYAGFALASGSPGSASASDGADRGARIDTARRGARIVSPVTLRSSLRGAVAMGRIMMRVRAPGAGRLRVRTTVRPGRRARRGPHARRSVRPRTVSLRVRRAGTRSVSVRLGRRLRGWLRRSHDARVTVRIRLGRDRWSAPVRLVLDD